MMAAGAEATTAATRVRIANEVAPDADAARRRGDDEAIARLCAALPPARRVLQVGADARLAREYLQRHPGSEWHAHPDADRPLDTATQRRFDLLVVDVALQRIADPLRLLRELSLLAGADASLFVHSVNAAHMDLFARLVEADLSAEPAAPTDALNRRHDSPSSVFKLLMDAGWMPTLQDQVADEAADPGVAAAAMAMADALGVPRRTAARTLRMRRLVIQARRSFADAAEDRGPACFSVVVPTTREMQLRLNVVQSPGLREVDARIVSVRDAGSPAQALDDALPQCERDWVLLCHQDVYFPAGFGHRLNALLAAIPADERDRTLIGFIGVGVNARADGVEPAGFVIDRMSRADHAASDKAMSIDELAIVVSRRSIHRIDPAIGWHLWATDLCLTSIAVHRRFPRIVRLPLFHNSLNDFVLPAAFHESAARLWAKHSAFGPIPTLCGTIDADHLARHGVAAPEVPAQPPASPEPAPRDDALCVHLDEVSARVDACIGQQRYDDALSCIAQGVHDNYRLEGVAHNALYYPAFDRQLEVLSDTLRSLSAKPGGKISPCNLIVATEMYRIGGHSRVVEDLANELAFPVVVLTDLFGTYHRDPGQVQWIRERLPRATVIVLPAVSMWEKCRMVDEAARNLQPHSIMYLGHHQDPIGFVATLHHEASRKILVHHADHNPSLGCTLEQVLHVDLSAGMRHICGHRHGENLPLLPLYVEDLGARSPAKESFRNISVATSGHPAKFARTGPTALQEIVKTSLLAVQGAFFHVGPLAEDWVEEIRVHLASHGIDPSRFTHLGAVDSVWATLKDVDASLYIGSAPVGGARASVEAQGCGLPVLFFNGSRSGPLIENYSLFAEPALGWSTLDELAALLDRAAAQWTPLSIKAREFYEANFSRENFRRSLDNILSIEPLHRSAGRCSHARLVTAPPVGGSRLAEAAA